MSAVQAVVADSYQRRNRRNQPQQPQDPIGWELWFAASVPLVGTIVGFFVAIIFG